MNDFLSQLLPYAHRVWERRENKTFSSTYL